MKYITLMGILMTTTSAFAAPKPLQPYVTIGIGESQFKDACDDRIGTCKDSDTTFRLGIGLPLQRHLAVELNYFNHGEASDERHALASSAKYSAEAQTFAIQLAAKAPINNMMNLYGKLGVANTKATLVHSMTFEPVTTSATEDSSETGLMLSTGVDLKMTPRVSAQLQIDYLPDAIKSEATDFNTDLQSYSIGLKFKF